MFAQMNLFQQPSRLPAGFLHQADFLSQRDEVDLVRRIEALPFKDFEFQGFIGKRRVVSFGWKYDFNDRQVQQAEDMPEFLLPLRKRAAEFANLGPEDLRHVLVTEYGPGAAIGWHKDKAVFGE